MYWRRLSTLHLPLRLLIASLEYTVCPPSCSWQVCIHQPHMFKYRNVHINNVETFLWTRTSGWIWLSSLIGWNYIRKMGWVFNWLNDWHQSEGMITTTCLGFLAFQSFLFSPSLCWFCAQKSLSWVGLAPSNSISSVESPWKHISW